MSSLRRVALPGLFLSVGVAALALAAPSALSFQAAGDVTLRGGSYAAINDNGGLLVTRASSTPDYVRRALLDFDTASIPAGVSITAATLTLTVHWGGTSALRDVAVYDVTTPFVESEATWDTASASRAWTTRGGDLGHEYARSAVPNAAGAKARFAVTSLVQAAVDAAGSAHTRVALVDVDSLSDARDGYRDYFSREAVDPAVRPLLQVTYSTTPPPPVPAFSNVFTILMENHEYSSIIGSANAPYINRLAAQYGLATNYTGVAHPSLPNYMALTGGRPVFTTDCIGCTTPARNVVDEVYDSGRTWKAYMESMPTACATTDTSLYVQKHNPFVHYDDIVKDRTRCVHHVVPFTQFDTDLRAGALPSYVWITPNMCNDMHNCPVATGDTWLSNVVPKIINSPVFAHSVIFILWDEGTTTIGGGGRIPALVISPWTPAGFRWDGAADHYDLLRTIEDAWGLAPLGQTASATALKEFFPGR